ncbi:hypothetical protein [Brevundimonas sp.]|uniref:hypothetical protein n=1 Tax=Brevundimonas sp. TaxID=1871086 RepID=UPI003AF48B61
MGPLPPDWTPADIEAAIVENDPEAMPYVPIAVSMGCDEADRAWAEEVCVRLSTHPQEWVRGNAILGFGHLARAFRMLDRATIEPLVRAALADPSPVVRGQAEAAADDIAHFLGWSAR